MNRLRLGITVLLLSVPFVAARAQTAAPTGVAQIPHQDWPGLGRYQEENAKLAPPGHDENRVVFMGDSITDFWGNGGKYPFFPGKPYIDRGISGQTTPQMLIRFRPDVIALHPKVVVILAGINDIAGNTGYESLETIEDNLTSMAELARANRIRVVLASITPTVDFPWRKGLDPSPKIQALNAWMKSYAESHNAVYADYYSAVVDATGAFKEGWSSDGVHPNEAGYAAMTPVAEKAIEAALKKRP